MNRWRLLSEADIVNTMSDSLALLKYTVGILVCVPSVQRRQQVVNTACLILSKHHIG